MTEMHAE